MERRTLLSFFAAAGLFGAGATAGMPRQTMDAILRDRLNVGSAAAARAIADRLPNDHRIGRTPGEAAGHLVADLGPNLDRGTARRAIRDDFATGRTVRCGGWQLSLTEARIAVLWA